MRFNVFEAIRYVIEIILKLAEVEVAPYSIPCASDEDALELVVSTPRKPNDPIFRARKSADEKPEPRPENFTPGELTIQRPSPTRWDVQVTGSSGGWLVFREAWVPDWKCNINGRDARMERVDHAFRAVRIPPGDSLVRTWYEPWSLRIGTTLTILAFVLAIWSERRMRRRDVRGATH